MNLKRFLFSGWVVFLLVGTLTSSGQAAPASEGRYVVVLAKTHADVRGVAAEHSRRYGSKVEHVYEQALKGYSATIRSDQIGSLRSDARVAYVTADELAYASAVSQIPTPSWGLDRVDQKSLPMDNSFSFENTGSKVPIYVLDTGIFFAHPDFGGRAKSGPDFVSKDDDASDCDGHGTHVAGTAGGSSFGVAKQSTLVSVRVLGCQGSGYWSWIIAGVEWVTAQHNATKTEINPAGSPAVVNMSLGGGSYDAADEAVSNSIAAGISYSVAAGNESRNACNRSPARVPAAMTNGASDRYDKKASFSNYGSCVDWYAPGVGIVSSTMDGASAAWNGTSMASPHTAGVAALLLEGSPAASPADVVAKISEIASKGIIKESRKSYKDLLFTNF